MNAQELTDELRATRHTLGLVAIGRRYLQEKPGRVYVPASELELAARQVVSDAVRIESEDDGALILDYGARR